MKDMLGNVIQKMRDKKIKFIRLQFVDINGTPKSISVPLGSDEDFEDLLEALEKYDGDPYGNESEENRRFYHRLESRGHLYVHRPYIRNQDTI